MTNTRERNPFWKGGRVIASNGYMLVKVGKDHPLADVRGYAYEHRLVAQEKAGRALKPDELIHHVNGIKLDNRPENLQIVTGNSNHFLLHRKPGSQLRSPGESNLKIKCACGCGLEFPKFDSEGRPRKFISGHNMRRSHG